MFNFNDSTSCCCFRRLLANGHFKKNLVEPFWNNVHLLNRRNPEIWSSVLGFSCCDFAYSDWVMEGSDGWIELMVCYIDRYDLIGAKIDTGWRSTCSLSGCDHTSQSCPVPANP